MVMLAVSALPLAGCAGYVRPGQVGKSIPYAPPPAATPPAPPVAQVHPVPARPAPAVVRKPGIPKCPRGAACVSSQPPDVILVNKQYPIPNWDVPDDLVATRVPFLSTQPGARRLLRAPAARAAERMFEAARAAGFTLYGISGFRSFDTQQQVFNSHVLEYGSAQKANFVSAYAGQSEHQTGLALDLTSASAGYRLGASFGATPEGRWLQANAAQFGFILRYPEGKESITGYSYEPWHWRYVGRRAAEAISHGGSTLEEYVLSRQQRASAE